MQALPDALFQTIEIGGVTLKNRLAMAPMTRRRSTLDGMPTDLNVEHYPQRGSAGLLVTEGIHPSPMGKGYLFTSAIAQLVALTASVQNKKIGAP